MLEKANTNFTGTIVKETVMEGSKSERLTHVLKTPDGNFPLRLKTSNPFYDGYFDQFIGKQVEVQGSKKISYLQVDQINEIKADK